MENNISSLLKYLDYRDKWYYFFYYLFSFLSFNPCYRGKFHNINLDNISSLRGEDLSNIDFTGAIITNCDLSKTNLSGTNFSNCIIKNSSIAQATCSRKTIFSGAHLENMDTYNTDFKFSILLEVKFISIQNNNELYNIISALREEFEEQVSDLQEEIDSLKAPISIASVGQNYVQQDKSVQKR